MRLTLCAATISLCMAIAPFATSAELTDKDAPLATPMPDDLIAQVFSGKTWVWKSGGGYFRADGRLLAWHRSDVGVSYTYGNWWVSEQGTLCFSGIWRGAEISGPDRACFLHRHIGDTIFQRREGEGNSWYIFKHSAVRTEDEYSKLKPGEYLDNEASKLMKLR